MVEFITNPSRYAVSIMDFRNEYDCFIVKDYTLGRNLGVTNYQAETMIRNYLIRIDEELVERVTFNSEFGCFFAEVKTQEDALKLAQHISDFVLERNPYASRGDIEDSPAFFSTGTE